MRKRSAATWKRLTAAVETARLTYLKARELVLWHGEHDLNIIEVERLATTGVLPDHIDPSTLRFQGVRPIDIAATLGIAEAPEIRQADWVYAQAMREYDKAYRKRFSWDMPPPEIQAA